MARFSRASPSATASSSMNTPRGRLRAVGRRFVLQGGTHRNLAVVKAQVDFIRSKVGDAEIVVHPHCGEAGAIGAALLAADRLDKELPGRFRGFGAVEALA